MYLCVILNNNDGPLGFMTANMSHKAKLASYVLVHVDLRSVYTIYNRYTVYFGISFSCFVKSHKVQYKSFVF